MFIFHFWQKQYQNKYQLLTFVPFNLLFPIKILKRHFLVEKTYIDDNP